jgi:colanic acid/amylovoran biosynthesis protein
MKAIIVPSITDLNKGDQALVWESHRLIKDTNMYDEIYILNSGDTGEEKNMLSRQSKLQGFMFAENILGHPRRGIHKDTEYIEDSTMALARQVIHAGIDFIKTSVLVSICNHLSLVKLFYPGRVFETVKLFARVDTVFVKGGGFIHAHGEMKAPYYMWYSLFYMRLAKALGKKVVVLPNSYGPFKGILVKNQVRKVLSQLDLVYAREHVSARKLGQLLNKNIPVEMDLGFFLRGSNQDEAVKILNKYDLSPGDKLVGMTLRPWRFPGKSNPGELYTRYLDSMEALSKHLLNSGYKIVLCNQSLGPNAHENDCFAIKDLLARVNHPRVVWINEDLTCEVLKVLYANFYFFIGTRFHSIIFSLTSLVPSIAIGYGGNKAKGIMSDLGLDQYIIQIEDIEPVSLINMFDAAIMNYHVIKNKLEIHMKSIPDRRSKLIQDIQTLYK